MKGVNCRVYDIDPYTYVVTSLGSYHYNLH